MKTWKCFRIHTRSHEQAVELLDDLVRLMKEMRHKSHLESYFFNRLVDSSSSISCLKLGLVNASPNAQSELNSLLEKHEITDDAIVPYECKMGFERTIDEMNVIACEMFEKLTDHLKDVTPNHLFYIVGSLMNQLGIGWDEQVKLYDRLLGMARGTQITRRR